MRGEGSQKNVPILTNQKCIMEIFIQLVRVASTVFVILSGSPKRSAAQPFGLVKLLCFTFDEQKRRFQARSSKLYFQSGVIPSVVSSESWCCFPVIFDDHSSCFVFRYRGAIMPT